MYTTDNMDYYPMRPENNFEMHFDDERPPIYNAEDYADHLRKYSRLTNTLKNTIKKCFKNCAYFLRKYLRLTKSIKCCKKNMKNKPTKLKKKVKNTNYF